MSLYQLDYTGLIIIRQNTDGSRSSILVSAANADYAAYLAWVAAGGVPDAADPAPAPSANQVADDTTLAAFPTRTQITGAVGQINTDLGTLGGTPTNAQVIAILMRALQRELYEIKSLAALVKRGAP